jgi:hypothetical protein
LPSDVFRNLYLVTNDSKLKNFQYKLLHRTLSTNTFLVKIGIKNSDLCNFCKNDTDSILHYIWLCPVVKLFWNRVKTWLEEIFDIPIELNMANIVFITNVNEFPFEIIEFVMLKWRIESVSFIQKLQRSEFFIPILTKNVFVSKVLWRSLYWNFFSFESFVTRYKLQKTSLIFISVSI